jgi:glutamate racemase
MIGVYDSGFGGLTVLRALKAALPERDFCYLGDSGRAPYGGRDTSLILDLSEQWVEHLFARGCRLVVVACHTVSCVALRHLQKRYAGPESGLRVLGVTIPAAEAAVAVAHHHIGWLGTSRTIKSKTWATELLKIRPELQATGIAAPLLAPLVEEGDPGADTGLEAIVRPAIRYYLKKLPEDVDTLVLGCTHYPLLRRFFQEEAAGRQVLDPSEAVAARLVDWLKRHPEFDQSGQSALTVLCTGDPMVFQELGARFLGSPLDKVEHLNEQEGRLYAVEKPLQLLGQVVR